MVIISWPFCVIWPEKFKFALSIHEISHVFLEYGYGIFVASIWVEFVAVDACDRVRIIRFAMYVFFSILFFILLFIFIIPVSIIKHLC